MDHISERRFRRKAALITALLCFLPQALRILFNAFYAYEVEGNVAYSAFIADTLYYGADILGRFGFFAAFGCAVYLSLIYGLERGGEWNVLLAGGYIVALILIAYFPNYIFGVIVFGIIALATAVFFMSFMKGGRSSAAITLSALTLPIFGGVIQSYAGGVPHINELLEGILYGIANLGFELLLLSSFTRIASVIRSKQEKKGICNSISVSGKLISVKNPAMLTFIIFDLFFFLLSAYTPTVNVISNIAEYGPPVNTAEWLSIFGVCGELIVLLIIGYVAMRFGAGLLDSTYNSCLQDGDED